MDKTIYAYYSVGDLNSLIKSHAGGKTTNYLDVKVGETTKKAGERIENQITAMAKDDIEYVAIEVGGSCKISDRDVHRILIKRSYATKYNSQRSVATNAYVPATQKEWFTFSFNTSDCSSSGNIRHKIKSTLLRVIEECLKIHSSSVSFRMSFRKEQEECIGKACSYLSNSGNRFLIAAKPRFGKTYVTFEIMKRMGWKRVLVLTYKTDTKIEWKYESERNHIKFIDTHCDGDGSECSLSFLSMQKAIHDNKNENEDDKYDISDDALLKQEYDAIIFDEAHYGSLTETATKIVDSINRKYTLKLSGTALKLSVCDQYSDENSYWFDYYKEQVIKKEELSRGINNRRGHKINIVIHDVYDSIHDNDKLKTMIGSDRNLTSRKLFEATPKKFVYESNVKSFIGMLINNGILDPKNVSCYGNEEKPSTNMFCKKPKRMLWRFDEIKQCDAIVEVIKEMLCEKYKIIKAYGISDSKKIGKIKEEINSEENAIVLSCGSLCTGVTIEKLDSVFWFSIVSSYETVLQTWFRCQSYDEEKQKFEEENVGVGGCNVFMFDQQIALKSIMLASDSSSCDDECNAVKTVEKFLTVTNVYKHCETGGFKNLSADDVVNNYYDSVNSVEAFSSMAYNCILKKGVENNYDRIIEQLSHLVESNHKTSKINVIHDGKIKDGVCKESEETSEINNETTKDSKKKLDDIINKLKNAVMTIPLFLLASDEEETSIESVKDNELFKEIVDIDFSLLENLVKKGVLDNRKMNEYIRLMSVVENS